MKRKVHLVSGFIWAGLVTACGRSYTHLHGHGFGLDRKGLKAREWNPPDFVTFSPKATTCLKCLQK